jgi:hypothetical protein
MIGRSGDVVCDPHRTRGGDEEREFPGLASKSMVMVCQWFGLKTKVDGLVICSSKSPRWFLGLGIKIKVDSLLIWASKSPRRFLGLGLKTKVDGLVICASKSPR